MKASITVRLDDQLKAQAEAVLDELGVSSTQAITHLYLYLVQHRQLPYRVRPVSESPEDVYRNLLQQMRAVSRLLSSVAGLPAEAPERPAMARHCLHRCRQLQQDIERNIGFMAGVSCRDPLPHTDDEDTGIYWQWMAEQLQRAVLALESPAPDLSATLTSVSGQLSRYYWQLATWIDLYELPESDETGRPV
ncbi:type II toxin-antitoxin system RelB/DinJ family antitoxin (plasmid) [Erwinia pyri]|uniref:Type II toxin-antitoxin system RelB/DinJ family antitoxin n=1 Tax=Erwinia pyri TaxID=3062598 RepID=A0AA50DNG1_9GAMM|nr:type II toxin-antitoxin system RelB/DinJ family antitoxin [Erwinia sp. DE2]WLS81159.1 type II toxin-antitoxin system RelB/DinJ family antitoxin [Erwinia sp. DE2]